MSARTESVAPGPAQWALTRMLDAAFNDREVATRCLELALSRARRDSVPEGAEDLLEFGREHLCPVLADELGPRIVAALFEDLVAELAQLRRSSLRVAEEREAPSAPPHLTVPPLSDPPSSLPTIQSPAPDETGATRKLIALVEPDRWTRALIARVLVQSGYDVLPLDSTAELSFARADAVLFVGEVPAGHPRAIAIGRDASAAQIAESLRRVLP